MYTQWTSPDGQTSCKVLLSSVERRQCSDEFKANTRNPLKFAGVLQTRQRILAVNWLKSTKLCEHVEEVLLLNKFFF